MSWFQRLRQGLGRSSERLTGSIAGIFRGRRRLDDATLEELEDALIMADLGPATAARLTQALARDKFDKEVGDEEVRTALADQIATILAPVARPLDIRPERKPHVVLVVGVNGTGKTTTIGKIAAQYVLEHGADSLALVTTDRYRVAAHEQLFVFGRILNVPVRVVDDTHSLDAVLDELQDRHLVLIDTAGLSGADPGCQEQLRELSQSRHPVRPHLVVPATSQSRIMKSMWHCYKMASLAGCILTKLDEALTLGEVLGFALETALPVAWITDGQKIPRDLHPANAASLVRLGVERLREARKLQTMAEGA